MIGGVLYPRSPSLGLVVRSSSRLTAHSVDCYVGFEVLMGPEGKQSLQTTLDPEAMCEREPGAALSPTRETGHAGSDISST